MRHDVYALCREAVSAEDAARHYGIEINRGTALCPFHNDKHPSMTFWNGRYRCWSCGVAGDSIDFTKRLLKLDSMSSALLRLNEDFHLNLSLDRPPNKEEQEQIQKRQEIVNLQREYEEWREQILLRLCAAIRVGHTALSVRRPLTDEEAFAVYWKAAMEYWADTLESKSLTEQMGVFRQNEELEQICTRILKTSCQKSKSA